MTFRQAEYDIRSKYENADNIVEALKEMIRRNNEFITHDGKEIAKGYFKDINEFKTKRMPKIELTDKEVRKIRALKSIGIPTEVICKRLGYGKTVMYRVYREENII